MNFAYEINFDGLVGPTYNTNGLSWTNEEAFKTDRSSSNPRLAFLDGLAKCKFLMDLGVKQAVLPPHERPHMPTFKKVGFQGTDEAILADVARYSPWLFQHTSSSSSMWASHSAHVTPSIDSVYKKVQITPANLHTQFHRSIEAETTGKILKAIFPNPVFFDHWDPLPSHDFFCDEGQSNHLRFAKNHYGPGVHLFGYGNTRIDDDEIEPKKYRSRQSKQASEAIKEQHKIYSNQALFSQMSPRGIDQGVFYNSLAALANLNFFLFHESAFHLSDFLLHDIRDCLSKKSDVDLNARMILEEEISLAAALRTKLFNSQLVTLPDGFMTMIASHQCQEDPQVFKYLQELSDSQDNPIRDLHFINMKHITNGGGPASTTLKVLLNQNEFEEMNKGVLLTEELYKKLFDWGKKWYRDSVNPKDMEDLKFYNENREALDALTQILSLGSIYSFQKN